MMLDVDNPDNHLVMTHHSHSSLAEIFPGVDLHEEQLDSCYGVFWPVSSRRFIDDESD